MDTTPHSKRWRISRRQFLQHATLAGFAFGVPGLASTGRAQAAAAPSQGEIAIQTPTGILPALIARPAGIGPFPGVIVCHNWHGLNNQVRQTMERLAQAGILAIAPNLYRSATAPDNTHARLLAEGLRMGQALDDVQHAAHYLHTSEKASTVGLLAFDYSDGLAFAVAQSNLPIEQIAIVYSGQAADALIDVHMGTIRPDLRLNGQRAFGPLVLHTDATDAWDRAVRWLKPAPTA